MFATVAFFAAAAVSTPESLEDVSTILGTLFACMNQYVFVIMILYQKHRLLHTRKTQGANILFMFAPWVSNFIRRRFLR